MLRPTLLSRRPRPTFFNPLSLLFIGVIAAQLLLALAFIPTAKAADTLITDCTNVATFEAAAIAGGNIRFACDGNLTLTSSITINSPTTIDASGRNVILSGGNTHRLFDVGSAGFLALVSLEVANGKATGNGGAISSNGSVLATNVRFTNNQATGDGGAIHQNSTTGSLTVANSFFTGGKGNNGAAITQVNSNAISIIGYTTFQSNTASNSGGAIANLGANLTITNSTFYQNGANASSGTPQAGAIVSAGGNVNLIMDTFKDNTAQTSPAALLQTGTGNITILNSIVSNATAVAGIPNCAGTITANGNNLEYTATTAVPVVVLANSCGFSLSGDPLFVNSSPAFVPAVNKGGPTPTLEIGATSPALNAASACSSATDQRYGARPATGSPLCDLGAFERGATPPTDTNISITKSFAPLKVGVNALSVATIKITNNNAQDITPAGFTDTMPTGLVIASPSGFSTSGCSATPVIAGDNSAIGVSISSIAGGGGVCTINFNVKSATAGLYTNSITQFFGAQIGTFAFASNIQGQLTVYKNPTLTKIFTPGIIPVGGASKLQLTIGNPNGTTTLNNISFTDTLPAAITVVGTSPDTNTCNISSSVTFPAGSIVVSGVNLSSSTSCVITVNVTSLVVNESPGHLNEVTSISSTETQTATISAQAYLKVTNCPAPLVVSDNADTNTCGTLRFALNLAGLRDEITFTLDTGGVGRVINVQTPLPEVKNGVRILGVSDTGPSCSTSEFAKIPTIQPIIGSTATVGLVLKGNNTLRGLKVVGFSGPQIRADAKALDNTGGNTITCTVAKKAP